MRVLIELDEQRYDVNIDQYHPSVSLLDLIRAAGGPELDAATELFVDSAAVRADTSMAEVILLEGSRIALTPVQRPQRIRGWNLALSGGLDASIVMELPLGRKMVVGRSPQADLVLPTESASWEHCTLEREAEGVRLRDSGSTNGTVVSGKAVAAEGLLLTETTSIMVGGAALLLRPMLDESPAPVPGTLHNITPAGTAPFNRPPRAGQPDDDDSLPTPARREVTQASKFSFITILAPLVLAGAMVMMLGDARFAMFAALTPVMAIGMWFEQKHRWRKNLKEEEERFDKEIEDFREKIAATAAVESARRHQTIPDPATVLRRPAMPTTLLWQRRAAAKDFLALHAGTGDVPWRPRVDQPGGRLDDAVKAVVEEAQLSAAPVLVDLTDAGVVGLVGERAAALAIARSLLSQAAVHCGPADLSIGVFCDNGREADWEWAAWLPHTRQAGSSTGERWMSNRYESSASMLRGLRESVDELPVPVFLVVLDSEVLTEGRDAPARTILGQGRSVPGKVVMPHQPGTRVCGIVIATAEEQLPASCTSVIRVGEDAAGTVLQPGDLSQVDDVVLAGLDTATAEECARNIAHFDDPEFVVPGASLPSLVRLPELLGYGTIDSAAVRTFWSAKTGVSTPIGTGENGPLTLDLVKDGPHGLVGGTTGSGKSEFLRSLVTGLAARNDPTRLNFILIDFKGGAAFKACERLPHTIGTISNLDEQLADRAVRALEAEMERRQRIFARAGEGIDNLDAYLASNPSEPMPRLLLIVDEFAMLAKDFPEVLTSLVSVAAVGRTLGVHMILATQRPAGVVSEDILANTNLRVALRVQSRDDSINVIGVPTAAGIGRDQSGRAFVKLGQDDITPVQTALVTGRARQSSSAAIELREIGLFGVPAARPALPPSTNGEANDLDLLIDAIVAANEESGYSPPRQIWPEALGERVELSGFEDPSTIGQIPAVGGFENQLVTVALVDEPDLQRQSPAGWDLRQGNLMLMGIAGSGTSTTLSALALALAQGCAPENLDLLVLDLGARELAPLADLPHTIAYVGTGAGGKEQQGRFLRYLRTELERRRADPANRRRTVVLIDGLATLRDEFEDYEGQELLDALYRVYAEGPSMGLFFAVATTRAKAVPSAMDEVTTQKWLFRLADPYDYSSVGVRPKNIPAAVPGRCVSPATSLQMHLATPGIGIPAAVRKVAIRWQDSSAKQAAIGRLPDEITVSQLGATPSLLGEPWLLPIGLHESTLTPVSLEVYGGEHVLIAGPARSGKSTLLLALAESLRTTPADKRKDGTAAKIWAICNRRSPLAEANLDRVAVGADQVPALLAGLRLERGPVFLLIDDAENFDDGDQSIAALLATNQAGLCIIASGRSADLRGLYSHWSKTVRKSRLGVLLQPDVDYDGELLGVMVPRRAPVMITRGRGYACVGGQATLVQTIRPDL